jgi:hypothetical protein
MCAQTNARSYMVETVITCAHNLAPNQVFRYMEESFMFGLGDHAFMTSKTQLNHIIQRRSLTFAKTKLACKYNSNTP